MDRKLCECPLQGATSLPRLRSRGWYEKDDEDADPKTDEMREERRGEEEKMKKGKKLCRSQCHIQQPDTPRMPLAHKPL